MIKKFLQFLFLEWLSRNLVLPITLVLAVMSVVDSEAVFRSRGKLIVLSDEVLDLFRDAGINTMGKLAFASSYVPGSADESAFVDLVKQALGRDATLGDFGRL